MLPERDAYSRNARVKDSGQIVIRENQAEEERSRHEFLTLWPPML